MKIYISRNRGAKMKLLKYLLIPLIGFSLVLSGCSKKEEEDKHEHTVVKEKDYWTCTMHPQVHRMDQEPAQFAEWT